MPRNPARDLNTLLDLRERHQRKYDRDAAALELTKAELERLDAEIAKYDGVDMTVEAGGASGVGAAHQPGAGEERGD